MSILVYLLLHADSINDVGIGVPRLTPLHRSRAASGRMPRRRHCTRGISTQWRSSATECGCITSSAALLHRREITGQPLRGEVGEWAPLLVAPADLASRWSGRYRPRRPSLGPLTTSLPRTVLTMRFWLMVAIDAHVRRGTTGGISTPTEALGSMPQSCASI
jgi:hypothetical protein